MSTTSYKPQPRELLPEWMIGMTDRIMDFYTKRYLHCDPVILKNPPPPQDGHKYLLYAHIPFCHTLCSYCTFHRFLFKEHVARAYFVNLRKEMDYVKALGYDFHSMYVGGGTTTIIEEELIKADLPVELRALPIIESALSTTATSPMGAVGLWQFMPATGKSYGLEINSFVDERRDPVQATRAACRYLKDLYSIYHDWTLAIAAYNCGPGNVNKALARAGGGTTFWDIYEYLPRETRGYVPAFVGASYAYAYHQQHGIQSENPPMPLATDTIRVTRLLHLGQVASTLDIPIETLRTLNPQYKMDIIPATIKSYTLVLPQHYLCQYIASEEEIHRKDSTYLKEYINPANIEKKKLADATPAYTTYTVKRGDTLGAIARRYRTTTAQIMKLNKLKNANKLREGQRLRIPIRR